MLLYEVQTQDLINELKGRFDSCAFVGNRVLSKNQQEFMIGWSGDSKQTCGMLFQASFAVANDIIKPGVFVKNG